MQRHAEGADDGVEETETVHRQGIVGSRDSHEAIGFSGNLLGSNGRCGGEQRTGERKTEDQERAEKEREEPRRQQGGQRLVRMRGQRSKS